MDNYALQLSRAFRGQHLIPLMIAHDVAHNFVPYDGIDIPEVRQAALDFLVGSVSQLQVFAGIVRSVQIVLIFMVYLLVFIAVQRDDINALKPMKVKRMAAHIPVYF